VYESILIVYMMNSIRFITIMCANTYLMGTLQRVKRVRRALRIGLSAICDAHCFNRNSSDVSHMGWVALQLQTQIGLRAK
jgi:hypothetical protein